MKRKLISTDEATESRCQHIRPCNDCPWSRESLRGWLGGSTPEEFRRAAHSDDAIKCHVHPNQQCAGVAIYRRNVCKFAYPPNLRLEADRETVFATPMEFLEHHSVVGVK